MNTKRKLFVSLAVWAMLQHCTFAVGEVATTASTMPTTMPVHALPFADGEAKLWMVGILGKPAAWEKNLICLIKVEQTKSNDGQVVPNVAKLVVLENFSDASVPAEFITPSGSIDLRINHDSTVNTISVGQNLLIWAELKEAVDTGNIASIAVLPKDKDRLVASLKLIQDYRKATVENKAKIAEAMLASKDDFPVRYRCQELLKGKHELSDKEKKLLLDARDEKSFYIRTRLQASDVLRRCDQKYREGGEHVAWIRQCFKEPADMSYRDCEDLLAQLRQYTDAKDFEKIDLPLMAELLRSPKTGKLEAACIFDWIGTCSYATQIDLETQDRVIHFLLNETSSQTDPKKSVEFLKAASRAISDISPQSLTFKGKPKADIDKAVQLLPEYEKLLTAQLNETKDANLRNLIEAILKNISSMKQPPK